MRSVLSSILKTRKALKTVRAPRPMSVRTWNLQTKELNLLSSFPIFRFVFRGAQR